MKKFLIKFLCLTLTIVSAFSLIACDPQENNGGNTGNEGSNNGGSNNNGSNNGGSNSGVTEEQGAKVYTGKNNVTHDSETGLSMARKALEETLKVEDVRAVKREQVVNRAKEIYKNISGLRNFAPVSDFEQEVLNMGSYKGIAKSRYVNDKQISDHYAIIPTGQGLVSLKNLPPIKANVYEVIVRRFLSIFYPPAVYRKVAVVLKREDESFFANFKVLVDKGYLKVAESFKKNNAEDEDSEEGKNDEALLEKIKSLKKNDILNVKGFEIKEGETSPPKRYNSGSLILAMENAGQLIEDEELRAQIKGSGIGTSATRAEILKKLVDKKYIRLNNKTQIITPSQLGEMVYDVVDNSIKRLLDPRLTASWEKGLTGVADGNITTEEYLEKLESFIAKNTSMVKVLNNVASMRTFFDATAQHYKK